MNETTIRFLFKRIRNHCELNKLKDFLVVFHGGEPLLAGTSFFSKFVEIGNEEIDKGQIHIEYAMQSNGVLITEEVASVLKKLNIHVGISFDGTEKSNNEFRVYHNGKGSYNDIINGFTNLNKVYGVENSGSLCVVDVLENPQDVYEHFKKIGTRFLHLLFPDQNFLHATYDTVPKVGEWLIDFFDIWVSDNSREKPSVKPFSYIVDMMLGHDNVGTEMFGKGYNGVLTIETDGSIETVDTLRICGDSFTRTDLNVLRNELGDIFDKYEIARSYYNAHHELSNICLNCDLVSICGGSFLGHRYSKENGFDNPSVYCFEIVKLLSHIQNYLVDNLTMQTIESSGVEKLQSEEIIRSIKSQMICMVK